MKASIEYSLIFLTGCFMLTLLIQFTSVAANIHKGHLFLNYVTHLTENYDGNLNDVNAHVESTTICDSCTYTHSLIDDRYEINVSFPINISVISYRSKMNITGITSSFE
ncbi:MAG: hypothetical protein GX038_06280 [Erysipelothrix sp.]|nr:hypothetical protein [Erysipelothrix sp.]